MRRRLLAPLLTLSLAASACSGQGEPPADGDAAPLAGVETGDDSPAPEAPSAVDAASDDPSDPDAAASDDPTAPSSTPSEPAPASSAPASQAPPSQAPASDQPPSSEDTLRPVPAGTYAYDTDGWSQLGDNPREDLPQRTTLVASTVGSDDVQEQTRDTRDEDGYGSQNTIILRYGVEGAVLLGSMLETTVDVFGSPFTQQSDLEADPPVVIAPHGFDVGSRATLHLVGDEVEVDGTLEVVGRERLTIGGTAVDTYVVEVHYDLSGSIEGTSDATWWVRPADLLTVKETSRTDVESRGLRYREQYDAQLTGLSPS